MKLAGKLKMGYYPVGGVLVYLIPDRRLTGKLATVLAYHFERIQVFRFPGEAYNLYQQIALFAVRKATPFRDDEALRTLRSIGAWTIAPPDLPERVEPAYSVPTSRRVANLLFQNLSVDPQDLVQEMERHGLTEVVVRRLHPEAARDRMRPIMPLRRGHLALVLASGHLNNELVEDPRTGDRLLVKGRTEKDAVRLEEQEADGSKTITERDVLKIVITSAGASTSARCSRPRRHPASSASVSPTGQSWPTAHGPGARPQAHLLPPMSRARILCGSQRAAALRPPRSSSSGTSRARLTSSSQTRSTN